MSNETTANVETFDESTLDEIGAMMLSKIRAWSAEIEQAETIVKAAKSDDANLAVIAMRDGSPGYDDYLALIEQAETLLAKIDAANKPKVKMPTEDEVKAAETVAETVRGEAKAGVNYLVSIYGDAVRSLFPENLAKRHRKAGAATSGTGKRPRLSGIRVSDAEGTELLVLNGDEGKDKPTFSNLSVWISEVSGTKVETKDLQEAAFGAAGTSDLSTKAGEVIEFAYTVGDTHYFVAVEPKAKA